MPDTPLKSLQNIAEALNTKKQMSDFLEAFAFAVKTLNELKAAAGSEQTQLRITFDRAVKDLKDIILKEAKDTKGQLVGQIETSLKGALEEQTKSLNYMRDWVRNLPQAKDGVNGKDADEVKIVAEVLAKVPPVVEQTGELIVDKINALSVEDDVDKIDASHIKNLPKVVEQHAAVIGANRPLWNLMDVDVQGITINQSIKWDGISRWIPYTPGSGGGGGGTLTSETPVGTINGSNTVFTVSNTPVQVFLNGALQTGGGVDYTLAGLTITFVNAPVSGSVLSSWYFSSVAQGTAKGEAPTGTINSSNVTFTLSQTPSPAAFLQLYLGRQLQVQGVDYTLSGATITYTTAPDIALVGLHYSYYLY